MPIKPKFKLPRGHTKMFYAVGAISLQWNKADFLLEMLIRYYLMPISDHISTLFESWGNDTKTQALRGIIPIEERDPAWREYGLHLLKYYIICKDNRNFVVHGFVHEMRDQSYVIERMTRKVDSRVRFRVPLKVLHKLEREIIVLCAHLDFLALHNGPSSRLLMSNQPLPEKPALPRSLDQILRPIRGKPQNRQRSSPASRRSAAKARQKK